MSNTDRSAADHAFVTLITSNDYLPGALAQSAALNDLHPTRRGGTFPKSAGLEEETDPVPFTTVCLVTPETVSIEVIKQLRRTFDLVIGVEVIEGDKDAEEIKLLGRPDLYQTFTKLHVLRLAQFASVVFMDADVLPLRPLSHLLNMVSSWPDDYFDGSSGDNTPTATAPGTVSGPSPFLTDASKISRNPLRLHNPAFPCPISAAPDSGWPDIFNSGVIVLAPPGERGFKEAMGFRSWDGGDQGTLNEWAGNQGTAAGSGSSGSGWNRLSFKYNVTPTAAYTYAPAYARFGTAIHAVHFIGSGKPWSSLPFRPPFISSSGRSAGKYAAGAYGLPGDVAAAKEAYGYHALVDRWFAVYDAHYRVEESDIEPKSEFEVRHYESAWEGGKDKEEFVSYDGGADSGARTTVPPDQSNQYPHVVPPYTYHVSVYTAPAGLPPSSTSAATLEELRRLALHGIGRADAARIGEGEYISMPLDGRISLMRPPRPDPVPVFLHRRREPEPEPEPPQQHQEHYHHEHHHESHHHEHHEPPRPASPPRIEWNSAVEPPPTAAPTHHSFPEVTYIHNQWDMPHQGSSQFFNPPEQTHYIPQQLIDEGHYSALTAHGSQPDHAQVKSVFPWEENKNRAAPERAFPQNAYIPPPPEHVHAAPAPAPTRVFPPEQSRELGAVYANAWDDIPSIQRYASRLMGVKPPPVVTKPEPQPEPPKTEKEWSWERNRGETDASSRDGDDEDDEEEEEGDEDGETKTKSSAPTSVADSKSPIAGNGSNGVAPRPKMGSRSGSRSASRSSRTSNTGSPVTQTLKSSSNPPAIGRNGNASLKGYSAYLAEKRKAQGALLDGRIATLGAGIPALGIEPFLPTSELPGLVWAPAAVLPALPESSEDRALPPSLTEHSRSSLFSVAGTLGSTLDILSHTRTRSYENELTDDSSLPPSPGASPPSELEPIMLPPARTFDEARSVDAVKRDSHEALARFLRVGSWGGETP